MASGGATIRIDPLNFLLGLAAVVAVISGAYGAWRILSRQHKRSEQFFRDWFGEDERPGFPARPGVLVRLQALETGQETLATQVGVIHAEVNYNHGGSIKDVVERIESDVKGIHERLDKGA
jgi:hypothetical protein